MSSSATTKSQKPAAVTREWYVLDASKLPVGRLAVQAAKFLIGKHKTTYTPHVDGGDYVIVINAANLVVTGKKLDQKKYYRHSMHPGSIKEKTLAQQMEASAAKVIEKAVYGMLPKNKLHSGMMKRLKVYDQAEHQHEAQKPKVWKG